jgi:hypothetical protein
MNVYELIYEDLSRLGRTMGTEYTTESSLGLFNNIDDAKLEAEKQYGKKLKWFKSGKHLCTNDLGYVMYHIKIRGVK